MNTYEGYLITQTVIKFIAVALILLEIVLCSRELYFYLQDRKKK